MCKFLKFHIGKIILRLAPEGRFHWLNKYALMLMDVDVGAGAIVYSSISISRNLIISIGNKTFIGSNAVITGAVNSKVTIGSYCDISDHVHFVTGTHLIDEFGIRAAGNGYSKDIVIGNGVWIGYKVLIMPGVSVGDNSIIGAGSVVNKDVPEKTIVAGNPIKFIRTLRSKSQD